MKRIVLGLIAAGTLTACQNPFPEGKEFSPKKVVETPDPPSLPYSIEIPATLQFREGETTEYEIKARVPAPGTPVVEISGLPEGAGFARSENKLSWTPSFDAANDPSDAMVVLKRYPVRIRVWSTETPSSVMEESAILWVSDVLRPISAQVRTIPEVVEGESFTERVTISSLDFPEGPFALGGRNLPDGMRIRKVEGQPTRFDLSYTPGLKTVTGRDASDAQGRFKQLAFELAISSPRGPLHFQPMTLKVRDRRVAPTFSAPIALTESGELSVQVLAEDPNGENAPVVTIDQRPAYGQVSLRANPAVPAQNSSTLRWYDIPPQRYGQSGDFVLRACVPPKFDGTQLCAQHSLQVTLMATPHLPPMVDRRQWPFGKMVDIVEGQTFTTTLEAMDADTGAPLESLEIEQAEGETDRITWVDGVLTIVTTTPGVKQFSLRAYSPYRVGRTEGFLYRVVAQGGGTR